jgi:hypothetical protein
MAALVGVLPIQSRFVALGMVSVAVTLTSPWAFSATGFTDRAAWENAVGATLTTDTFSNDIGEGVNGEIEIVFDSGIISEYVGNPFMIVRNQVRDGQYRGYVAGPNSQCILWKFRNPVTAFGGDYSGLTFSSTFPTLGLTVTGDFDGTGPSSVNIPQAIGNDEGFFGLVGTVPFPSVRYCTLPSGGGPETFEVDDFSLESVQ